MAMSLPVAATRQQFGLAVADADAPVAAPLAGQDAVAVAAGVAVAVDGPSAAASDTRAATSSRSMSKRSGGPDASASTTDRRPFERAPDRD